MDTPQPYTSPSPALQAFINKTLRVTTTDARFFVGELKCTDRDRNLILAGTTEHRYPSNNDVLNAAAEAGGNATRVRVDMTSRFIGLVVVPGNVITKIEMQESGRRSGWGFGGHGGAVEALRRAVA